MIMIIKRKPQTNKTQGTYTLHYTVTPSTILLRGGGRGREREGDLYFTLHRHSRTILLRGEGGGTYISPYTVTPRTILLMEGGGEGGYILYPTPSPPVPFC